MPRIGRETLGKADGRTRKKGSVSPGLSDDGLVYVTTFGGSVYRGPVVPQKGDGNG